MAACRVKEIEVYFLTVPMRVPLKFGAQTVRHSTCARARVVIEDAVGRSSEGWGETPLSVAWVWPSQELAWEVREEKLQALCLSLARTMVAAGQWLHPMELGHRLTAELDRFDSAIPLLAKLCCLSPLDLAVFDAFANLAQKPVFETLDAALEPFLGPGFAAHRVPEFLRARQNPLPVWHLVGGLDPLEAADLDGTEPEDGYPILLRDWIRRDGLRCLKVKLRGTDGPWDFARLVAVGRIAIEEGCDWLTADFNCTVTDPAYVCEILDRLLVEEPRLYGMLLYIEQPFPYELSEHPIDVRSVSARKPLFLDESAHNWEQVRLGLELGWTGVALKTCKTLTGALLSLCWARSHGMTLMVQDLTNPMLAQISHVLLAAHAGTLMGVESNAMQFYPEGSRPEEKIHPGIYRRRNGVLDLSSLGDTGFGYRTSEMERVLPESALRI
ncbi:MAG: enolase C-terminal domain-like protein [Verrucomicrobiales bacterium]